ncbi:MAG: heavy-metal-associated domain-containing protein [Gemmatimonadales bacterium]|jgi:copper chaperone|nr:heavy-metal-associated domain-containing protein [Gemmatimonadales bacterium]
MASAQLSVTGMTCGHCQKKVENALNGVDGVLGVFVDREAGSAEVEYDGSRTDVTALVAAVEVVGYGASATT